MKQGKVYKLHLNENQYCLNYRNCLKRIVPNKDINLYLESRVETTKLTEKIAKKFIVDKENVILANGIDEILLVIAISSYRLKGKIGITEYTYKGFEHAIKYIQGTIGKEKEQKIIKLSLSNMQTNLDLILNEIKCQDVCMVYVCNPHNPIGNVMVGDLDKFLKYTLENNIIVVFDEAYAEYADRSFLSMINYVKKYRNICVTRTFSKAYGLAGLRCGYIITYNDFLISNIEQFHQAIPYSVNRFVYEMASRIIDSDDYLKNVVKKTNRARKYLVTRIKNLGIKVYPSTTNFVLIKYGNKSDKLIKFLKKRNIFVRDAGDFDLYGFIRITLGRIEQMQEIVSQIKEFKSIKE